MSLLDRLRDLCAQREERTAGAYALVADLSAAAAADRPEAARAMKLSLGVEGAYLMIALARDERRRPTEATAWAQCALAVLPPAPTPTMAEIAALAWSEIGNAARIERDDRRAQEAFSAAQRCLQAVVDPVVQLEYASLYASWLDARRDLSSAASVLDAALELAQTVGVERQLERRLLINRGLVLLHAEEPERAIEYLVRAFEMIDGAEDPWLALATCHNLAEALVDIGRLDMAVPLLISWERVYQRDALLAARRQWLLARIGLSSGYTPVAAALLDEARAYFQRAGRPLESALIEETALELALARGDREAAAEAAADLYLWATRLTLPAELLGAAGALLQLARKGAPGDVEAARTAARAVAMHLRRKPALDVVP